MSEIIHKVKLVLSYKGEDYNLKFDDKCQEPKAHEQSSDNGTWCDPLYYYKEGNMSCDCNRSNRIVEQCDGDFPDLPCGKNIELKKIVLDGGDEGFLL